MCYPVADLHCDYFPEIVAARQIGTARSLSLSQLLWCQQYWSRDFTIHLWGTEGLRQILRIFPRGRLLVQLHDLSAEQIKLLLDAVQAGWKTGISVCPDLVGPALDAFASLPVAVQVLSTSTPGCIGGSFLHSTWTALQHLQSVRRACDDHWSIEVDGGLTPGVLHRLASYCDLAVVGSNYLNARPEMGWLVPDQLLENTWLKTVFTN